MLPLLGIPKTVAKFLKQYRNVFCKEAGFKHISRYINSLLMSPNKTLQGIYSQLVWYETEKVSRRAMHEAVFEAGWDYKELMERQRIVASKMHRGKGRELIALVEGGGNKDIAPHIVRDNLRDFSSSQKTGELLVKDSILLLVKPYTTYCNSFITYCLKENLLKKFWR